MGTMKRKAEQERERKLSWKAKGVGGPANWMGVDRDLLTQAIAAVAESGGALRFGYTRDGGAYAVGVYGDGDPYTEYIRPNEDVNGFLAAIVRDYSG